MCQFSKVLLSIDKVHTVPQGPWFNQAYRSNHPTPSVQSICGKYIKFCTRWTVNNKKT